LEYGVKGLDWCIGFLVFRIYLTEGQVWAWPQAWVGGDDYDSPFGVSLVEIEQVVVV